MLHIPHNHTNHTEVSLTIAESCTTAEKLVNHDKNNEQKTQVNYIEFTQISLCVELKFHTSIQH